MAKFNLLAGAFVVSNSPLVMVDAPAVVESDRDLVAAFGEQKFSHAAEDAPVSEPAPAPEAKDAAPSGKKPSKS